MKKFAAILILLISAVSAAYAQPVPNAPKNSEILPPVPRHSEILPGSQQRVVMPVPQKTTNWWLELEGEYVNYQVLINDIVVAEGYRRQSGERFKTETPMNKHLRLGANKVSIITDGRAEAFLKTRLYDRNLQATAVIEGTQAGSRTESTQLYIHDDILLQQQ